MASAVDFLDAPDKPSADAFLDAPSPNAISFLDAPEVRSRELVDQPPAPTAQEQQQSSLTKTINDYAAGNVPSSTGQGGDTKLEDSLFATGSRAPAIKEFYEDGSNFSYMTRKRMQDAYKSGFKTPTLAETAMTPALDIVPRMTATEIADSLGVDPSGTTARTGAVLQKIGSDTINFFTSPTGIATLGLGAAPKLVQEIAGAAFAAHIGKQAPDIVHEFLDAKTPEERDEALVKMGETGLVLGGVGGHLSGRPTTGGAGLREPGVPEAKIDRVLEQKNIKESLPPTEPKDAQITKNDTIDSLLTARNTLDKDFHLQPPEIQHQRQPQIDNIDSQLLAMDKGQVQAREQAFKDAEQTKAPAATESAAPAAPSETSAGGPPTEPISPETPQQPVITQESPTKYSGEFQIGKNTYRFTASRNDPPHVWEIHFGANHSLSRTGDGVSNVKNSFLPYVDAVTQKITADHPEAIFRIAADTTQKIRVFKGILKKEGFEITKDGNHFKAKPPSKPAVASGAAPEPINPTPDVTVRETPTDLSGLDPEYIKTYQDSAERIADQVSQNQPTSVRDAARDAAFDNAVSSMKNGKDPSVSFMRKSAQEAAGKALEKQGTSLETPVGETTVGETLAAPEPAKLNEELHAPLDQALSTLSPRDADIVRSAYDPSITQADLAAKHGISETRVSQIIKDSLPKLREALKGAGFTEADYTGGPGAMGPIEALEMKAAQHTTGLAKEIVNRERLAEGREEIPVPERQHEEHVIQAAEDRVDANPFEGQKVVSQILEEGKAITEHDAATLLVERVRLQNERAQWEERIARGETPDLARKSLDTIETQIDRLDHAQRAAGTTWGRLGRMYQRAIRDDFTSESIERQTRAKLGRPLNEAERTKIKEQTDKIDDLQKKVDEAQAKATQTAEDEGVTRLLESTINELGKSYLKKPEYTKDVLEIVRGVVSKWKDEAAQAREDFKNSSWFGGESGGVGGVGGGPGGRKLGEQNAARHTAIVHLAKIIRAELGEFGLKRAEAIDRLVSEFGEKVRPIAGAAYDKAKSLISDQKIGPKAQKVVEEGISKKNEPTTGEITARAKAEAVAGEPISHKTVYDQVRAIVNSGIHGEKEVFTAAHEALKEAYPGLTERDVRRAFSEYGKVKLPNPAADKKELRELRVLSRLQESIDRIQKDALDPLKTGQQRDKASILVRDKMKQLSELLKRREGPASPEKLATAEQAKQTALKNRIEEIDRELKTGEKTTGRTPSQDSIETEQLRAEKNAMQEKLDEIRQAENPGKTPEERYNDTRMKAVNKQLAELEAKNKAGDFSKPPKRYPKQFKSKELQDREFLLHKAKQEAIQGLVESERKARYTVSPENSRSKVIAAKTLDTAKETYHTFRAVMTGGELSGVLRQGKFSVLAHPIIVAKGALPAMFKAFRSEKNEHAIMSEIQSRPNAELYRRSGLVINDPSNFTAAQLEGNYRSRFANKIPLIAGSGRAYTVFLNRMRADIFDTLHDKLVSKEGPISLPQAKALATFVNESTGTGHLGDAGTKAAELLNATFFAPKFVASRFQLLAGHSLWKGDATTRKIIAGEYGRILAGAAVMYGAYSLLGTKKIETDPRSSQFGKIPVEGPNGSITYIDPLGGVIQASTILSKLASGKEKNADGTFTKIRTDSEGKAAFGKGVGAQLAKFARSKAAPLPGAIYDRLAGEDFNGNPITLRSQVQGLAFPMTYGDIYDALKAQGVPKGTALSILALFGEGVNTYQQR